MFTGIVEELGDVREIRQGEGVTVRIGAEQVLEGTRLGDSIAVDGVCLTVTALGSGWFEVGLAPETLRRSALGQLDAGGRVNLERALAVGDRMGGHYVQGHVDATGTVLSREPDGDSLRMRFSVPSALERYIVEKGFIAIDGISLTITEVGADWFGIMLIAYTQSKVTLSGKQPGALVNLEVDVLAKYAERILLAGGRADAEESGGD